jgi:hypothetical protein
VALALLVMPFARRVWAVHRLLPGRRPGWIPSGRVAPARAAALVPAVAARLPWPTTCLDRALTTAYALAWCGAGGELVMAVCQSAGGFEAHAWVEGPHCLPESLPTGDWHPVARWSVPLDLAST